MTASIRHIFLISLFAKLLLGAILPLFPDEAYYWVWGHHLQLNYYDHPAMVGLLMWLGQPFESVLSMVRLPAIAFGHLAGIFWFLALKRHFSKDSLHWWALLFAFNPLTGPGSCIVTPDLPLMVFWGLGFYLLQLLIDTRKPQYAWALGLCFGLGLTSKYVMVIFAPLAVLWLWLEGISLKQISSWLLLTLPGIALGSFPVWYWNIQNDFISLNFQLRHGLAEREPWKAEWTLAYIGGEILAIFPLVLWSIWKKPNWNLRGLWVFTIGPFLFFLLTSFRAKPELNWPIVGFPAVLALAAAAGHNRGFRWCKQTIVIWLIATSILISDMLSPWIPARRIKTHEPHLYSEFLTTLKPLDAPLFVRTYQMAGLLSHRLKREVPKLKGLSRLDFYDFTSISHPSTETFYLVAFKWEGLPDEWNQEYEISKRVPLDHEYELLTVNKR